jgi:DNA repair protein RecN (Recombination protein N)
VFDEIDLGISGEVAIKVGELIQALSQEHQIVCITHLPQIAAMGSRHFRVNKYEDQGRSYSQIAQIKGKERTKEIGQMIGGLKAGDNAMRSAQELLQKFAASEI